MADGADSEAEKTEAPTPRRAQEAADEGRIPRSPELSVAVALLGAAATVSAVMPSISSRLMSLFATGLRAIGDHPGDSGASLGLLQTTGREMLTIVAILGAGLAATALSVGALQGRGTLTLIPLAPKWARINPMSNAGRMLGMQAVVDLGKSLLKLAIVGSAVWKTLSAAWPDFMDLSARDPLSLLGTVQSYSVKLLTTAGLSYLVLASADYGWQFWQHLKGLRMTKDEVKRESKQNEGDPMLKSRVRSIARARIRRQMMAAVPKADVVIVNPTHIAIALRYDPNEAPAPIVLAMGQELIALKIKELAFEHGIPVIENRPLARGLLASASVGLMIPAELYAAVAEILAFVLQQRAAAGKPVTWPRTPDA